MSDEAELSDVQRLAQAVMCLAVAVSKLAAPGHDEASVNGDCDRAMDWIDPLLIGETK